MAIPDNLSSALAILDLEAHCRSVHGIEIMYFEIVYFEILYFDVSSFCVRHKFFIQMEIVGYVSCARYIQGLVGARL